MSSKITFATVLNVAKVIIAAVAVLGALYGSFSAYHQWREDQKIFQDDLSDVKIQIKNLVDIDTSKDTIVYELNRSLILLNDKIEATSIITNQTSRKIDKVQSVLIDFITKYDPLTKEDLSRIMKELYNEGDLKKKEIIPYLTQQEEE